MTATAAEVLPRLAPISLDELVAQAELLTRRDRKYVVPLATSARLLAALAGSARVLEIGGRREFGYRSTYLDTPDHRSFLTAGRSERRRWKVRTRTYLDTGTSWLEVKTRVGRDRTMKQRIEHPEALGGPLTPAGQQFVDQLIGPALAPRLRPVLVTAYRRTSLFLSGSCSRATVDVELGWTSLQPLQDLDRPSLAIVETKTGATPSEVDRLLWSWGHRPVRLSKYGVGMAALHPDLPRLKWHRAMVRHLDLPTQPSPNRSNP